MKMFKRERDLRAEHTRLFKLGEWEKMQWVRFRLIDHLNKRAASLARNRKET